MWNNELFYIIFRIHRKNFLIYYFFIICISSCATTSYCNEYKSNATHINSKKIGFSQPDECLGPPSQEELVFLCKIWLLNDKEEESKKFNW